MTYNEINCKKIAYNFNLQYIFYFLRLWRFNNRNGCIMICQKLIFSVLNAVTIVYHYLFSLKHTFLNICSQVFFHLNNRMRYSHDDFFYLVYLFVI